MCSSTNPNPGRTTAAGCTTPSTSQLQQRLSQETLIMSFTQKHLDAVEAAIARGEKTVRYADRTVEYRTVDELLKARDQIRTSLVASAGPRSKVVRLYHGGKGL